jgi:N-acetyl-anhydromuramyl-L-alanine amidase AmpD
MTYTAHYPDGTSEVLLSVPRYDFNWQITYELAKPKRLPKGTKVEVVAHYDNSPGNKHNPDPTKDVKWGDQTWEEMMIGFWGSVAAAPTTAQQQ